MEDHEWMGRLKAAIENDPRRPSTISRDAGMSINHVEQFLKGKSKQGPTVSTLIKLCKTLNVSVTHVLLGVEMSPEDEEILDYAGSLDDSGKRALVDFLRSLSSKP